MNIVLIGVALGKKDNEVVGFKLLDLDAKSTMVASYDSVLKVVAANPSAVRGLEVKGGKLVGSNGALSRYPNTTSAKKQPLIVLDEIYDAGYRVCDINGNIVSLVAKEVIHYAKTFGIANGKVVERANGTEYISPISGKYSELKPNYPFSLSKFDGSKVEFAAKSAEVTTKEETPAKPVSKSDGSKPVAVMQTVSAKEREGKKKEREELLKRLSDIQKEQSQARSLMNPPIVRVIQPKIPANAMRDKWARNSAESMTVEQKMVKGLLVLRGCRPFYYCILANLPKIATEDLPTLGVTVDEFFYNVEFTAGLEMPELIFILIHESMHIAFMHSARQGTRIHSLWNIACDYFINKVISEEFGLTDTHRFSQIREDTTSSGIKLPDGALYNSKVNIKTDTVEKIYDELLESYQSQQNQKQGQNQSSNSGQNGQNNSGQESQNPTQNQQDSGNQEQQSEAQNGQSQENSQGQNQQNNGQNSGQGQNQGQNQQNSGQNSGQSQGQNQGQSGNSGVTVSFRGQKLQVGGDDFNGRDLVATKRTSEMSQTEKNEKSKSVLKKAATQKRQMTGSFGGEAGSFIEREVEEMLAPKVNWVALLKNKLTKASQTVMTYAKPDKRFVSRGMIMPGPKPLDNDSLSNIKVCIDTSGSISKEDLGIALNQINQLLKRFKAEAEVLYWDTQVRLVAPFKNIQELVRIKPEGGGGTDVNCVFEHFNSKDYRTGRKQRPSIIIIITDGYFGDVDSKHKKYIDTIWVVNGNYYKQFKPPFGKKATLKPAES